MRYFKGQYEGAMGIGLVVVLLLIALAAGFVALKVFIAGIALFVVVRMLKSDNTKDKPLLAPLIIALLLSIGFVVGEFFPKVVDVPASYNPQLCQLHYAFPLHFLWDIQAIDTCITGAAISQGHLSLCSQEWGGNTRRCLAQAIEAGVRDCTGITNQFFLNRCYYTLAYKTSNASPCENLNGSVSSSEYRQQPALCVYDVMRNNPSSVDCDALETELLREFCGEAYQNLLLGECTRKRYEIDICGKHRTFDEIDCIANNSANPSFCDLKENSFERDDCFKLLAMEKSDPSVCEKINFSRDREECLNCVYNQTK